MSFYLLLLSVFVLLLMVNVLRFIAGRFVSFCSMKGKYLVKVYESIVELFLASQQTQTIMSLAFFFHKHMLVILKFELSQSVLSQSNLSYFTLIIQVYILFL